MDTATTTAALFFSVLLPVGIFIMYTESEEAADAEYEKAIRAHIADMDPSGYLVDNRLGRQAPRRDCPSCGAPWAATCPYCQRSA